MKRKENSKDAETWTVDRGPGWGSVRYLGPFGTREEAVSHSYFDDEVVRTAPGARGQ